MEFIFQLLAQLFGNVEDSIVDSVEVSGSQAFHSEEIAQYEADVEVASIPNPDFFNGIEFH